jgi:hypothetical protein
MAVGRFGCAYSCDQKFFMIMSVKYSAAPLSIVSAFDSNRRARHYLVTRAKAVGSKPPSKLVFSGGFGLNRHLIGKQPQQRARSNNSFYRDVTARKTN